MNFGKNLFILLLKQNNVGGIVALPPTVCLRAAHLSACSTAHVQRTGSARTGNSQVKGSLRRSIEIHPGCPWERF
jgi:hypothetical protein